ncbi:hypothetical protein [uncultured Methanobrevibacter sp.]|uniref:hypothetical protein n=1 Tax=uncultured Methanobrevibacter sp. TaxID=253161 RepID=UPI0025DF8D53|nr:hypothetical protein [uncultured Methanobrevibacter sp.]
MNKKILAILLFGVFILSIGIVSAEILYQDPLNGMDEKTFKKQCEEVTYRDIKPNEDLKNHPIKLKGMVEMATHNTMVFYAEGFRDQEVIINLPPDQDNSQYKKYQGLNAVIYGTYQGLDDFSFSGERPYISIAAIE